MKSVRALADDGTCRSNSPIECVARAKGARLGLPKCLRAWFSTCALGWSDHSSWSGLVTWKVCERFSNTWLQIMCDRQAKTLWLVGAGEMHCIVLIPLYCGLRYAPLLTCKGIQPSHSHRSCPSSTLHGSGTIHSTVTADNHFRKGCGKVPTRSASCNGITNQIFDCFKRSTRLFENNITWN